MSESERFDHAHQYELIEEAFTLWRAGERAMQGSPWLVPSVREAHERAVSVGVELLRRYSSMNELLVAYYTPHFVDEEEYPSAGENESWVDYACRVAGAWQASRAIVEDASYFRRARELIVRASEEGGAAGG